MKISAAGTEIHGYAAWRAKVDVEILKALAKKYPDLHLDTESIEKELNSINAAYENALRETRKRN